jgi:hypothetical protein
VSIVSDSSCLLFQSVPNLSVGLSNTLDLFFLLDGITVSRLLRGIGEFVGNALSNGLAVTECRVTGTLADHGEGDVHTTERRNINGLALDLASLKKK